MSIELMGNLIAAGGILVLDIALFIAIQLLLDEPIKEEYKYCYDCKYGLCMENPKSANCLKWQDEKNSKSG